MFHITSSAMVGLFLYLLAHVIFFVEINDIYSKVTLCVLVMIIAIQSFYGVIYYREAGDNFNKHTSIKAEKY
jgi:hypothetical protein